MKDFGAKTNILERILNNIEREVRLVLRRLYAKNKKQGSDYEAIATEFLAYIGFDLILGEDDFIAMYQLLLCDQAVRQSQWSAHTFFSLRFLIYLRLGLAYLWFIKYRVMFVKEISKGSVASLYWTNRLFLAQKIAYVFLFMLAKGPTRLKVLALEEQVRLALTRVLAGSYPYALPCVGGAEACVKCGDLRKASASCDL
ncbi:hypothetical protein M0802_011365 [Mischocyttarus mexicanus]|nr:hypothetical protein M0802_011365 [Mischocyttarus mexicanus]